MNWEQLNTAGIIRLRPKGTREMPDGQIVEVDEEWLIERATPKDGVQLINCRSKARARLNADHVKGYSSDSMTVASDGYKRGFLTVTMAVAVSSSNGVSVEPFPLVKKPAAQASDPDKMGLSEQAIQILDWIFEDEEVTDERIMTRFRLWRSEVDFYISQLYEKCLISYPDEDHLHAPSGYRIIPNGTELLKKIGRR